mmetsp:Transcript_14197/g.39046  ORF Transcript_14197/g.39046 Transcript_14197/m.39046 type:complete len:205 (+) Transcript_14197:619-1233(+)
MEAARLDAVYLQQLFSHRNHGKCGQTQRLHKQSVCVLIERFGDAEKLVTPQGEKRHNEGVPTVHHVGTISKCVVMPEDPLEIDRRHVPKRVRPFHPIQPFLLQAALANLPTAGIWDRRHRAQRALYNEQEPSAHHDLRPNMDSFRCVHEHKSHETHGEECGDGVEPSELDRHWGAHPIFDRVLQLIEQQTVPRPCGVGHGSLDL